MFRWVSSNDILEKSFLKCWVQFEARGFSEISFVEEQAESTEMAEKRKVRRIILIGFSFQDSKKL